MNHPYDRLANSYQQTRKADPYLSKKILQLLPADSSGSYLDIGCGTGNYSNELQKAGLRVIGIDPSEQMLKIAKRRNGQIAWKQGTADNTGLEKKSIGGITAILTTHHWPELKSGFRELRRVLKPGGKLLIFTSTPEQMKGYWLNRYFPEIMARSAAQMPDLSSTRTALLSAGFLNIETSPYFIQPDLEDKFLYSGKHDPERYFDVDFRMGISSFSNLANPEELTRGLNLLRHDLDQQLFEEIKARFENELGDYLWILAS